MRKRGIAPLVIIVIAGALIVLVSALYLLFRNTVEAPPGGRACTLEAKLCPDGSYVGRQPPNCEFAPCPSPRVRGDCSGPGDTSCPQGYVCIQSCGPPVVRDTDPPPPYYCELEEEAKKPRICPICLSAASEIASPDGPISVSALKAGMRVWSLDLRGEKIASTVLRVSRTSAPVTHQVVHLVLSDGREARVSPGHPTADGRTAGQLRVGDLYDGAHVRMTEMTPYQDKETFDLLPDSPTGLYWADGILFGSTLR